MVIFRPGHLGSKNNKRQQVLSVALINYRRIPGKKGLGWTTPPNRQVCLVLRAGLRWIKRLSQLHYWWRVCCWCVVSYATLTKECLLLKVRNENGQEGYVPTLSCVLPSPDKSAASVVDRYAIYPISSRIGRFQYGWILAHYSLSADIFKP